MKVAIFVDASNMFMAQKRMKWHIDYKKVREHFSRGKELTGLFFFTSTPYFADPQKVEGYRKFRASLILSDYEVVAKEVREITDRKTGKKRRKCNLDVEIALYMLIHADRYDELVLLSGDSDFVAVLQYLKNNRKKITCVAKEPVTLDFINVSDRFVDLDDVRNQIEK